jgi:hypothetical protein
LLIGNALRVLRVFARRFQSEEALGKSGMRHAHFMAYEANDVRAV